MYHRVYGTRANVQTLRMDGNCRRDVAVEYAQNMIRFASWDRAVVMAGKRNPRTVYIVEPMPDT